ncbi:cubilin-like [Clavelina lepadiformis]|uniref:CUB domain-containing protein n=1 Tax=Clavelina lepadiformis TaxID=159417 RepID=A0ABP0G5T0_CLALP
MAVTVLFSAVFISLLIVQRINGQACEENLTATLNEQVLTSPNYPNRHPNNLNCVWTIKVPVNSSAQVLITLTDLHTEQCCDHLEIYDGDTLIADRFKGERTGEYPMVSSTGMLRVQFRSDGSVAYTGFRATFRTALNCGGILNASDTVSHFSTPFYPDPHPHNMDCFWVLKASPKKKVDLTIAEGKTDECCDYLDIYQGTKLLERLKGTFSTPKVYSEHKLFVYFHSNSNTARDGFRAFYKEFSCGGEYDIMDEATNVMTSPNYPNNTEHNLNCTYTFKAQPGFRIELTMEVDTEACCDYIEVYDGREKIGRLAGKIPHTNVASTGQFLTLVYISDSTLPSNGFRTRYRQFLPGCGFTKVATNDYQSFNSPGYPRQYLSNMKCDWVFSAYADQQIVLTITELETEECCDFVQIFDGLKVIGKLSGTLSSPITLVSNGRNLRVRLSTDSANEAKGFKAKFKLGENCGSEKSATIRSTNTLSTPNYPVDHADNLDCLWTVKAPDGLQVLINITEGETETCCDYIQIMDGLKPLGNVRGQINTVQSFTSSSNVARVYFHSDDSGTRDGFRASYAAVCIKYINVNSTMPTSFSSPNYPGHSPHNTRCNYYFTSAPGTAIELAFSEIDTENCCDYLEVYKDDTTQRYKGSPTAPTIQSTSNTIRLYYYTDSSVGSKGFQLMYRQI